MNSKKRFVKLCDCSSFRTARLVWHILIMMFVFKSSARHFIKEVTLFFFEWIAGQDKDPVTKEQQTDAIYSIPCNDCDNEYIG